MPSIGWTLRGKARLLELSVGGRWFIGLILGIGVAAISSGNNVIYLLESLLLSALLLSGVLSELTLSRVRVTRETGNLYAGIPGEDVFLVENLGPMPLYCLELGEYFDDERVFTAFLLALPGHARVRVRSRPMVPERGRHAWEGLLVATSFPFGFARKIRILPKVGSRIVWPSPSREGRHRAREENSPRGQVELVADEVVQAEPWQDVSRVHWPSTARAGMLMARPVRRLEPQREILLELRHPGPEMEREISRATGAIAFDRGEVSPTLVLVDKAEHQKIPGRTRALDSLALLPKGERAT